VGTKYLKSKGKEPIGGLFTLPCERQAGAIHPIDINAIFVLNLVF
jgi:hypothetical protein